MQKRAYFYWKSVYVALGVHYLAESLQLRKYIVWAKNPRLREVGPSPLYS